MKKIIVCSGQEPEEKYNNNIHGVYYDIQNVMPSFFEENENLKVDYAIINADIDKFKNSEIINNLKKHGTKVWAYTTNTARENTMSLYTDGYDNVIPPPKSINSLIHTMVDPDNSDDNLTNGGNYQNSKKVLIVSADRLNMELLFYTLEDFDFLYTVRTNLQDAIKEIAKDHYDLIIIDSINPGDDVFDAAQYINQSLLNRNTPFIFISATPETEKLLKSYQLGSYAYLEKPYNIEILHAQITNILKIKELQDSLYRENNLLENLINNSINQPIITDSNFIILTGGNQHLKINRNEYLFGLFSSCEIEYPENRIRDFSRNLEKTLKFSFTYKNKFFDTVITKVYSTTGVLESYIVSIEDITQKLLIEEQKETFIATLTHDLKSPIRAELNVLQQLIDEKFGTLNQDQKMILTEMLKSREYTKRMVDNILTRYKITSDKFELLIEQNSYKQTLENAINEISHLITDKKQELVVSYNAETDVFLFDRTETTRVLANLISNAAEYTQSGGKITITISEDDENIITEVKDNGYGISDDDIEFVFDKNVTLAKKYRKVGSGLGLYISKSIINAHGGEITVKSKQNKGSTFAFSLPKYPQNSMQLNYAEQLQNI